MQATSKSGSNTPAHPTVISPSDPGAAYRAHREELNEAIQRVLDSGWYILGSEVDAFESEFAAYMQAKEAVAVSSGTAGLHLALRACGVGPGDAVATVSHTAVATVAAIEMAGATPILVDIDPASFNLSPQSLEDALEASLKEPNLVGRAKAIIPVHLYGQPADMSEVLAIAKQHDLYVIEDCSQAHGATLEGRRVGTFGDFGVFSLYPTKNLAALGDAGIVTTQDGTLAKRLRRLREYGWSQPQKVSEEPGFNSRLDAIQAAVLRVRLKYLEDDNTARREIAALYDRVLKNALVTCPTRYELALSVYHQYVVRAMNRDHVQSRLRDAGINTLIHYPQAVHQQPAYVDRLPQLVSLAHTEAAVQEILSLPIYPQLSLQSARFVADAVVEAVK